MSARLQAIRNEQGLRALRRGDMDALTSAANGAPDPDAFWQHMNKWEPTRSFWSGKPGVGKWAAANWQHEVHNDPSTRILVRGGNKTGKTSGISGNLAAYFDGVHPHWKLPKGRPARVLYVVADLKNAYADDVCMSLREFFPPSTWGAGVRYSESAGFKVSGKKHFRHRDGHSIMIRSGTQDGQAIAGLWADVVIVNEPPVLKRWGETMRAAALIPGAPVLVCFTPIDDHGVSRDVTWLREYIEDPKRAGRWTEHVVPLTPANAPWRDPVDIENQIADMLDWEVGQRRDAEWEGPAPERTLASFGPDNVININPGEWAALPFVVADTDIQIGMVGDHGELTAKEHWVLYAYQGTTNPMSWVLDEYIAKGETSVETDALGLIDMLDRWGLSPEHVDRWHGDTNSAGKSHLGSLNDLFAAAILSLTGVRVRIQSAIKGPGSVGMGTRVLNNAYANRRSFVNAKCAPKTRRCLDRWDGRPTSPFKDGVDTVRYGPGGLYRPTKGNVRRIARR